MGVFHNVIADARPQPLEPPAPPLLAETAPSPFAPMEQPLDRRPDPAPHFTVREGGPGSVPTPAPERQARSASFPQNDQTPLDYEVGTGSETVSHGEFRKRSEVARESECIESVPSDPDDGAADRPLRPSRRQEAHSGADRPPDLFSQPGETLSFSVARDEPTRAVNRVAAAAPAAARRARDRAAEAAGPSGARGPDQRIPLLEPPARPARRATAGEPLRLRPPLAQFERSVSFGATDSVRLPAAEPRHAPVDTPPTPARPAAALPFTTPTPASPDSPAQVGGASGAAEAPHGAIERAVEPPVPRPTRHRAATAAAAEPRFQPGAALPPGERPPAERQLSRERAKPAAADAPSVPRPPEGQPAVARRGQAPAVPVVAIRAPAAPPPVSSQLSQSVRLRPREPDVHIGRVEVVVEAPPADAAPTSRGAAASPTADFASRLYLRRL